MWDRGEVPLFPNPATQFRVNFVPVAQCMIDLVGRAADVDALEYRTVSTGNTIRILPHADLNLVIIPS